MKRVLIWMIGMLTAGFAAAAPVSSVSWKTPLYSLVARAMPVREALDTFGVAQGVPVICSPLVTGTFSGTFTDVPAADFLDRLATMHNLTWYYDGATIFVSATSESVSTLIDLRYMKAGEVTAMLKELGVEDERFPLKTASNDELIMVSGPPRYVTLVAEMIGKADKLREQRTFTEVETRLFPLSNTWADNVSFSVSSPESGCTIQGVAYLLQEIMGVSDVGQVAEGTNAAARAESRKPETALIQPVIRPENRLNAVLVRDVATRMPMYADLIRKLDVPQRLVEIEVTTLELAKDDSLDWQLSLKVTGAHSDFSGGAGQNAANLFTSDAIAGKGLAGAISYLGKNVNVYASLSALRSKGKARSISRTSILTVNNLAAAMSDTQSYHAKVVGREVASLESVSAGTRLEVKPRILEPDPADTNGTTKVWLSMSLQDGGFESLSVDDMPVTRTSTLDTQAALPEGEALLMAGYFRDIEEEAGWGIPYLRDIPFIGWLFGGASKTKTTVQRLFILTPRVITFTPAGGVVQGQAVRQRDLTGVEEIQDASAESDDERELRQLERDRLREIRREQIEDRLEVRKEEIKAEREVREAIRKEAKGK